MLVEVGILCVVLTRSPERCEAGKRILRIDSCDSVTLTAVGQGEPELFSGLHLEDALALDLSLVREVRHVSVERADNNLLVWIALDNPIAEVRERVFQKELELIEGFPEIDFDFNVVQAKSRDPHQFASSAKVIYSRKDLDGAN
ncbi:MAG: hypothetical protein WBX02_04980 [Terriglobales bacterium]